MTAATIDTPRAMTAPASASWAAFRALLARDVRVLRRDKVSFLARTIMQPALLLFVFTYVFPKIGQGIGGASSASPGGFNSLIVGGLLGVAAIFTGIQSVALPLVQEFGYTREIEDRVMAPLPVWMIGMQKILTGAIQGFLAAAVVLPLALVIPAGGVHLEVNWPILLTVTPLACLLGGSLGLTMGTKVQPQQVTLLFSLLLLPMTFLGCVYYAWATLEPIPWLQYFVLVNPLTFMSEGFRAAIVPGVETMSLWVIYPVMIAFIVVLARTGIQGFRTRVLD